MGPKTMDYEEGQAIPPGYHVASRARKGLVIAGAATLGGGFLITVVSGLFIQAICAVDKVGETARGDDCSEYSPIYIPVAGPFIAIGTAQPEGGLIGYLAVLGAIQTAGLGMLIAGLAARQEYLARDDVGKPKITVAPVVGKSSVGLGLVGSM